MTTNKTPENLKQELKSELERSILLDPQQSAFWLISLPSLPLQTVENLLKLLKPNNEIVDGYIEAALSQDERQEHLADLQNQIKKIKQEAFKIEEKSTAKSEQNTEAELLEKLDEV